MGRAKLLLPWGDSTVIEQVLTAWHASGVSEIVVVVHPEDARLAELCRATGALIVVAGSPPPDMKASVRLGLDYIAAARQPRDSDAWLVAPADMPRLSAMAIDRVLASHDSRAPTIVVPRCGERRGHPVLFPWSLARDVASLGEDEGINRLLERHVVREVSLEEVETQIDLDTPDDYTRHRP